MKQLISGIAYVEFYVANICHSLHFYRNTFGFSPIAKLGPETGESSQTSIHLKKNQIQIILSSPLDPTSKLASHLSSHGDGVRDVAFLTGDCASSFEHAVKKGAKPVLEPIELKNEYSSTKLIKSSIATFGDTIHSFIESSDSGTLLPKFKPLQMSNFPVDELTPALTAIDHLAVCLGKGTLAKWIQFYQDVCDFHISHEENIQTKNSGMESVVVQSSANGCVLPLCAPSSKGKKSQIDEYLQYYNAPGVQHIAFLTNDIFQATQELRSKGIEFLAIPDAYYEELPNRINGIACDFARLKEQQILLDQDEKGFLLQIFSKPIQTRPTFFIELIQREGSDGFGSGNIKSLFKALENEQARRGNI